MVRSVRVVVTGISLAAALLIAVPPAMASPHDLLPALGMIYPHVTSPPNPSPVLAREARGPSTRTSGRPPILVPLYLSFASLQVLDADSTRDAIRRGHREWNPVLRTIAEDRRAMLLVKLGATAATFVAVERLWRHNRTAAVLTMVGVNMGYALIVAHNYRKAR